MAKGAGFFAGIGAKAKTAGNKIISNLKVDGGMDAIAKGVAGREGTAIRKNLKSFGEEMAKNKSKMSSIEIDGALQSARRSKEMSNTFYKVQGQKDLYNALSKSQDPMFRSSMLNTPEARFAKGMASQYFWNGANKAQRATRLGAVGAGAIGVSAVGRAATGGTMTRNKNGERDIAGIPFV